MDKKTVIIGGILAALGVVALVVLTRGSGGSAAQSPAVAAPLQIPQYPQAPPLPGLNIVATPYYQTFNIAPDRKLQPSPTNTDNSQTKCACTDENTVVYSNAFVKQSVQNLRARFSMGASAGNMVEQFPPNLYPWLYQSVGSA